MASRSENINLIQKYYGKRIILIDRFIDSTIAYQHFGMGVNLKLIKVLNDFLLKGVRVNFTFLNIVNSKNMSVRLKKRMSLNRYDQFNTQFYKKVQAGFIKLSKIDKNKYLKVDSNLDISFNKKMIISKIDNLIK